LFSLLAGRQRAVLNGPIQPILKARLGALEASIILKKV
jgi:hypothetical protein